MENSTTIYKVDITLANMNSHFYKDFNLTLAKSPLETEEEMMHRLLALMYYANDELEFSSQKNNDGLCQTSVEGSVINWIELGEPDEKTIRQCAGKSQNVFVMTPNQDSTDKWLKKVKNKIPKDKVTIHTHDIFENGPVEKLVERGMKLSCMIDGDQVYLGNDSERVGITVHQKSLH